MKQSSVARTCALFSVIVLAQLAPAPASAQQLPFFVIVNPANNVEVLSRSSLSAMFLKRSTTWQDDTMVTPVDLPPTSPLRATFSREINDKTVAEVQHYWQEAESKGRGTEPMEVASEADAVEYVKTHRGAVAYVSTTANLDGVKIVPLIVPPTAVRRVPPMYSARAKRMGIEGDVVLRVMVDESGSVQDVTVLEGLGFGLTEEAIRAVKRWRFQPATSGGIPIASDVDVKISFKL